MPGAALREVPRCSLNSPKTTVAYLGPAGTYTHQIAFNRFGNAVQYISKATVADVFQSVPSEAQIAVIPKENSIFGSVVETYDLIRLPELGKTKFIRDEFELPIQHCLVVADGTTLNDIMHIYSHEQALGQCTNYLRKHLPHATLHKTPSTAAAAESILAEPLRSNSAAICSAVCTSVFPGLQLLEAGIQNVKSNFTSFWIVSGTGHIPSPNFQAGVSDSKRAAVLRLSQPVDEANGFSISDILSTIILPVRSIDRRPSLDPEPFHDTYFVQLESDGCISRLETWAKNVADAGGRIRHAGWKVEILGFW